MGHFAGFFEKKGQKPILAVILITFQLNVFLVILIPIPM